MDFPERTRSGQFVVKGRLEINPDRGRVREEIAISVLVEDAFTGDALDARDHGSLVAVPTEEYRRNVTEKFELPSGTYRIRFRAAYPNVAIRNQDGSTSPGVVAEATRVVTVD